MEIEGNAEYLKRKYPDFEIFKYTDDFDGSIEYWSHLHGEAIKFNWDCMTWMKSCLSEFWVTETCVRVL